MTWPNQVFSFPSMLATICDGAETALVGADAETDSASARLSSVSHTYDLSSIAAAGQGVASYRAALNAAIDANIQILCVHPFQHALDTNEFNGLGLSAPNAIKRIADKLKDKADYLKPDGSLASVCGLFPAGDLSQFVALLSDFNQLFPIPEMLLAQRRAQQELDIEVSKFQLFDAPITPHWHERNLPSHDYFSEAKNSIGEQLGIVEAYDLENVDPLYELAALSEIKKTHNQAVQNTVSSFRNSLSGNANQWLYLEGDPETMAANLINSNPAGHEFVMSAAIIFVAPHADLILLKEVFSL